MINLLRAAAAALFAIVAASAANAATAPVAAGAATSTAAAQQGQDTIYEWLARRGRFSQIVSLIDAAGMQEELSTGDYTFFAPPNNAFGKLDEGQASYAASTPQIARAIVTRHMLGRSIARIEAADRRVFELRSVNGAMIYAMINRNGSVFIDGARIRSFDRMASNGVIHVIDHVLMD